MCKVSSHPILVVSARWQTRALLAAQLAEVTGRDVIPAPAVNQALRLIKLGGIDPALLVVDAGRQTRREGVERLLEATTGVPMVVVASVLHSGSLDSLRDRCAAYLPRPVTIGRVAQVVAQILEELQ